MGKKKGTWRKFFCCAGPPETQSSTCVNISESDHTVPPPVPEIEQEDEDVAIEAEVQTSGTEIPEGNRWRWSRLHNEVEVQTSFTSYPFEEIDTSSEADAQIQTSFSSIPRQIEAHAQTSFLSLRSPSPLECDAHMQTSFVEIPKEIEAQVQTSLLSLPEEKEAEAQTSFLSLHRTGSAGSLKKLVQAHPAYLEYLEKIAPYSTLVDSQVQTSKLTLPPSQVDIQVQTTFPDYMSEKEDGSSIHTPESLHERSSSQLSDVDHLYMDPAYTDAGVQTVPVEIPPGNDWRSSRLRTAQVQTTIYSLKGQPVPRSQNIIQVKPAKLEAERAEEMARILEARRASLPPDLTEAGIQTSDIQLQEWDKWCSPRQQVNAQVQTSTIELLKKLSLLSQIAKIESMDAASRTELLKKMSQVQTSSPELTRKASALSESAIEDQDLSPAPLKKRPSSAEVSPWSYELAQILSSSPQTKDDETHASDQELKKRLSHLSLTKTSDESKEDLTPQDIDSQIRKWYEELPEVQTSDPQGAVQKQALWSPFMENEVQTPYIDMPFRSKWRSSSMQADHECQTEFVSSLDDSRSSPQSGLQRQASLLEVWQARDLAEAQMQTSALDVDQVSPSLKEEPSSPSTLVMDSQVQTSLLDIWKAKEHHADIQTQTSMTEHPGEPTSFLDIWKAKELENLRQKTAAEAELLESEGEISPVLYRDLEMKADGWSGKEKTDAQVPSSFLELLEGQEQPHISQVDAQMQTTSKLSDLKGHISSPNVEVDLEPPHPSEVGIERKTSLLDMWKVKESEVQPQTSWMDVPKSEKEAALPPGTRVDMQVQTSLLDIWRKKELNEFQMQTPWKDSQNLVEEPPVPVPCFKETEIQTSLTDIWRKKEVGDVQIQTPWSDSPKSPEDHLPAPPSFKDIKVQASLIDTWKTIESQIESQTAFAETAKSGEEPSVPSTSRIADTQVQTSLVDVWKAKHMSEFRSQTPWTHAFKSDEELPCSVTSFTDSEAQTSVTDLWKLRDLRDSEMQTSLSDLQISMGGSSIPSWSAESCRPPQIDIEVQTSSTEIWRKKEIMDANTQTSFVDLTQSAESLPYTLQIESTEQPCTSHYEVKAVPPPYPSSAQMASEKQVSLSEVKEPADIQEQRFEFLKTGTQVPSSSQSVPGVHTIQVVSRTLEKVPDAQIPSTSAVLPSTTIVPVIQPQTAVSVQLPTPEKAGTVPPGEDRALSPMSLLQQWTTREEEEELQKQTDNLGLSFGDDLALFPLLEEGQICPTTTPEKEKLEEVSKKEIKTKVPVFTEAQVQTSYVEIPRGKKWRASRLCTEAQVQTSFHDIHVKDKVPGFQKTVSDHAAAKKVLKGPRRAAPVSVHLHVRMSPKRRTSSEKK